MDANADANASNNNGINLDQVKQAVVDAAGRHGVDPDFALRIARQESNFNPNARGSSGEIGVMQLEPSTAKMLGVDPRDPMANIDGGVRYLKEMHEKFGGDERLTAAAYNAGPGRVHSWVSGKAMSLPLSTQAYVQKTALAPDAGKLYQRPQAPQQNAAPAQNDMPPLPPGAVLEDAQPAQSAQPAQNDIPPLPAGAVLDDWKPTAAPAWALPPGYSVDAAPTKNAPNPAGANSAGANPAWALPPGYSIAGKDGADDWVTGTPPANVTGGFKDRWGNLSPSPTPTNATGTVPVKQSAIIDASQQLPSGILEAAQNLPSSGARLANLAGHGIQSALNYAFPNSSYVKGMQAEQDKDDATAAGIQKDMPSISNVLPQPTTAAGSVARNIGEFAPAALMPGSAVQRVTSVVAPAVASQGAAEAAKTLGASPGVQDAVRLATAIGTGARVGAGPETPPSPPLAAIHDAATNGYTAARNMGVELRASGVQSVAQGIHNDLSNDGFRDYLAPKTFATLNEMKNPPQGSTVNISDLDGMRRVLGKAGMSADPTERAAAARAINGLDDYMLNIPAGDVLKGDAQAASNVLSEARTNYSTAMTGQRVQDKLNSAELRAASTGSGGNVNNATRQNLRTLLTNKNQGRGLTQDELEMIENTVRGSTVGNTLRGIGKLLGGDFGATGGIEAMGGAHFLGPAGYLLPLGGYAVKKAGDFTTTARVNAIVNAIAARSSLGQQLAGAHNAALPARVAQQAIISGLLSPNAGAVAP